MKKTLLALGIPYLLSAHTMSELFNALKSHSQTKFDEIQIKKTQVSISQAKSALYPKINLFANYDMYTYPTSMRPVAPNKKDKAQPFSYNILKSGINFSMPVYIKSIYTMTTKAKIMQQSAKAKKHIDLLQNEAIIVGANANLIYLEALKKSLNAKTKSLLSTLKIIKIKVANGRTPASALFKINDELNQINIAKNNIALQKNQIISTIKSLTGISISKPIPMQYNSKIVEGKIKSLQPLKEKIKADEIEVKAQKEKLYPSVIAHGIYFYTSGEAYNNHQDIDNTYGSIGLSINIPLFTKTQTQAIAKSKIELESQVVELQKLRDELKAKAQMLNKSLILLKHSISLSQKNVKNKEQLLKIAKVNYESGRLSIEEYLRYEDDIVEAKANLFKAKAQKWQTRMELAVIYANNIEEIVK